MALRHKISNTLFLLVFLLFSAKLDAQIPTASQDVTAQSNSEVDSIVVLPVSLAKDIEPKTALLLNEVVLSELAGVVPHTIRVIGSSDVQALIGLDKFRHALGCKDSSCLVEIGQALGASHLMQMTLGAMGDKYVVSIKLLTSNDARVVFRRMSYVEQNDDKLLLAVKSIIQELSWQFHWKKKKPAVSTLTSQPVMMWGSLAGGTLGLLATSALAWLATQDYLQVIATGAEALPRDKQRETAVYGILKSGGTILAGGTSLFLGYVFIQSLFMEEVSSNDEE